MGRAAPIISWLHQQGLRGTASGKVLEGLCEQLLTAGVNLDRSVVGYLVFHPQFDGMNFTWTRSTRTAERQAVIRTDILRLPSPFLNMQATGTREMRYRLDDPDVVLPFPFLDRLRSLGYKDYFAFFEPFGTYADRRVRPDLPDGLIMHEGGTRALIRRHANPKTVMEKPGPATGSVEGIFPVQPCNPARRPHI